MSIMPAHVASLLALATTLAVAPAFAQVRELQGEAYAADGGRLIYRESHWIYPHDGGEARLVLYRCPDGHPFARKQVSGGPIAQAPDFDLLDARDGYREGVLSAAGGRQVYVRNDDRGRRSAPLSLAPLLVIDVGFDAFIRQHWTELAQGKPLKAPLLIPSRLGSLNFMIERQADITIDARSIRVFRLSLDSLIGFALPHLDVSYDATTHQLRRFQGIANIRDSQGKNPAVRIEFPTSEINDDATIAAVDAAAALPLDGRCDLR